MTGIDNHHVTAPRPRKTPRHPEKIQPPPVARVAATFRSPMPLFDFVAAAFRGGRLFFWITRVLLPLLHTPLRYNTNVHTSVRPLFLLPFLSLFLSACHKPHPATIAITHATIIDATGSPPKPNSTILIDHEKIYALGPRLFHPNPSRHPHNRRHRQISNPRPRRHAYPPDGRR